MLYVEIVLRLILVLTQMVNILRCATAAFSEQYLLGKSQLKTFVLALC
jgi:hypothetical protein